MKKILITGITGQDGLFLTEKYLNENENHFVYGISRSNDLNLFYKKLNTLHVKSVENLKILNIDLNNRNQVFDLLKKINPQAVYNFSVPSSVYQSLDNKEGSISTIKNIFDNLTESLIKLENFCNFFQASSSEMFENVSNNEID